ncbi:unnamed protein product [Pleuronectes platessa]|uniref:Uncharacterized protein n=1 Tax=Pleuronectes platessa TaxID=8262 RepID=A0A9N7YV85_PLEPL|nr:unnamed protein product [Pleuronectes platessa]
MNLRVLKWSPAALWSLSSTSTQSRPRPRSSWLQDTSLTQMLKLLIYYRDAHKPTAVVEAGQASAKPGSLMGDPVLMLSLYPEFPPVCDVFTRLTWRVCAPTGSIWEYGLSQRVMASSKNLELPVPGILYCSC